MLVQLVDAISDAALMVGSEPPHRPWIDVLPELLPPHQLAHALDGIDRAARADLGAVVGLADDPARQCRVPLAWHPGDGNLLLVGAVGTGVTTTAAAVVAALTSDADPTALHVFVIDGRGDGVWSGVVRLAHCGAVVRLGEPERLIRLVRHLSDELDRRSAAAVRTPQVVVVLDGAAPVREVLGAITVTDAGLAQLDRLVRDGPSLGLSVCITTDGASTGALAMPRSSTWVFRVDDPAVVRSLGIRTGGTVGVPGRLRVVESGLDAQVVFDRAPLDRCRCGPDPDDRDRADGPGAHPGWPRRIDVLAEVVDAERLDASCGAGSVDAQLLRIVVGVGADELEPAQLWVPLGDHVFIGGGARTGRSTALRQIESAWRRLHPDATVVVVDRVHPLGAEVGSESSPGAPVLVLVDDAERVDDPDGRLAGLVACRAPGLMVAVAARLEAVRVAYGHWTREVVRSRCGLIMTSAGDVDGELLGATLPRRSMIPPRPGLAWLVDQRGHMLVQVAARMHP